MKVAVVIGAGPAGLSVAAKLLELSSEWRVIILEASNEIGGISRTILHNGCRIDIGGHRFFSKSHEINDFWQKLLPIQGHPSWDDITLNRQCRIADDGPDPEKEDKVLLFRHRISRIYYLRHFFNYPISISLSTIFALGFCRTLKAAFSYIIAVFRKRTEKTLEDFYINRFGRVLYSMFFEDYTQKLWGVHPSQISPEWGVQRVKGLSLWKALLNVCIPNDNKREISLIEEFFYPKYGPGQLWETLADNLCQKGVEIRLNSEVTQIIAKENKITGVVAGGETIDCDAVFSSMPIKDLIASLPGVPHDIASIAATLPYRDFMTIGIKVERLAIQNKTKIPTVGNLIPDTWIYIQDRGVKMGRVQIFNNWSPYMVDDPKRHVWIGIEYFCSEGDSIWSMSDSEFTDMAISELKKIDLLSEDAPVLDSILLRVKKAYPAYFGSYAHFSAIRKHLDTFGNLYCIGRNGQHRYNNMDHSMLTAFEAARALVKGTGKDSIWEVNTEEAYHESK